MENAPYANIELEQSDMKSAKNGEVKSGGVGAKFFKLRHSNRKSDEIFHMGERDMKTMDEKHHKIFGKRIF